LEEKGLVRKEVKLKPMPPEPTPELKRYYEEGFPELNVYRKARAGKSIQDLSPEEKQYGIQWAKKKGWVQVVGGRLIPKIENLEVKGGQNAGPSNYFSTAELIERGLLTEKTEKEITIEITEKGLSAEFSEGLAQLTPEMLRTGSWKGRKFKPYDVSVPSRDARTGKSHPLSMAMGRIRDIFSEMGFEEMEGNYVESAFWNFDALFQPQDHPARELADTFYLEGSEPLPDKALVERVKKAHEKGWKCPWSEAEARKRVLRTHTTASSARYLASMKSTPKKYFAIGRVFRNEATDYKHLAEFHQVEGIVAWENATFKDLLGLLAEFYSKLGFKRIRFRPSYFPYTEPSLEIIVYFEPRKEWVEMGGAGIMRPEVSLPLAGTYPVLAWGLSLERPLMMLMGLSDIRAFYKNDVAWLRKARVKL
ncbi:MAG: phenylalanine--tRNA ligase subunit alpha, partial [Candidatus ainarchaeum sp.]|nr:phenylalanine--tRNA ligase subunit alpha [Candidatus ainarchaeum sp.]